MAGAKFNLVIATNFTLDNLIVTKRETAAARALVDARNGGSAERASQRVTPRHVRCQPVSSAGLWGLVVLLQAPSCVHLVDCCRRFRVVRARYVTCTHARDDRMLYISMTSFICIYSSCCWLLNKTVATVTWMGISRGFKSQVLNPLMVLAS